MDTTMMQTDSSLTCDCNLEQFEERLGAVEHGLVTSTEATKVWTKRIEQTEVDIVNLHRQMYTILSKAEFIPPSSDIFNRLPGDSTPTDFYDDSLYKVPDIIVETKKEIEQGDLFKNSLRNMTSEENWGARMEEELEKINEITSSSQIAPIVISDLSDANKIQENLMRKNEELKEKTRGIVKAMEEAVLASTARKPNKLGVHSHFVAPYKRIQNADPDFNLPTSLKVKPNSKFK